MSKYPIKIQSDLLMNIPNYSVYDPSMGHTILATDNIRRYG
jgi:hypothetical protein